MMEMFLHVSFSPSREPLPCDAQCQYWTASLGTRLTEHVANTDAVVPSHLPSSALTPLQKMRFIGKEAILGGKRCPSLFTPSSRRRTASLLLLWSRALLLRSLPSSPLLLPAVAPLLPAQHPGTQLPPAPGSIALRQAAGKAPRRLPFR